jgi:pimeloyl-ACP methyl ester carboxylesterase
MARTDCLDSRFRGNDVVKAEATSSAREDSMRTAVNGAEVYAYTGSRAFDPELPTVVFVHGAAHDHSVWALQSRYFAHHRRNVLAVDLPGHGRSGGEPLASVEAIGEWLVALLNAAHVNQATLVGHSLGALAVLEASGRHPERVENLALLGPALPLPVAAAHPDAAKANDHLAYELITGWSFAPGHQLGGNQQPGVWMTGNALRLMERSQSGALYADLVACHRYAGGLAAAGKVRCPALLILGQRDLMAPAKNATALIAALAGCRVVTVPDCGHSLMAEAPDTVLDALRAFLRPLGS